MMKNPSKIPVGIGIVLASTLALAAPAAARPVVPPGPGESAAQTIHRLQAEGFRVEQGGVATDDAGGFQVAHAAQAGGRRQAGALGQRDVGDAGVGLEMVEQAQIGRVEGGFFANIAHNVVIVWIYCPWCRKAWRFGNDCSPA